MILAFSLWVTWGRGIWTELVVEADTLTLSHRNGSQLRIPRDSLLMLELRDKCVVVKWKAQPKDRVEVLGRERFSPQSWDQLRAALQPWTT